MNRIKQLIYIPNDDQVDCISFENQYDNIYKANNKPPLLKCNIKYADSRYGSSNGQGREALKQISEACKKVGGKVIYRSYKIFIDKYRRHHVTTIKEVEYQV